MQLTKASAGGYSRDEGCLCDARQSKSTSAEEDLHRILEDVLEEDLLHHLEDALKEDLVCFVGNTTYTTHYTPRSMLLMDAKTPLHSTTHFDAKELLALTYAHSLFPCFIQAPNEEIARGAL